MRLGVRDERRGTSRLESHVGIQDQDVGFGRRRDQRVLVVSERTRALVDVRAHVTAALERQIRRLGGRIVTTTPSLDSIVAWMPLLKLERLAESPAVRAIEPAATAMTVR